MVLVLQEGTVAVVLHRDWQQTRVVQLLVHLPQPHHQLVLLLQQLAQFVCVLLAHLGLGFGG